MSALVFVALLGAGLLHASWNAIVKSGPEKFFDIALVMSCAGLIAAVCLPFLPPPAAASWPYIVLSTFIEQIYLLLLAAAYRRGEMSEAYPLMRGTAPLLVALAGGPLVGEALSLERWLAVALICAGVTAMAFDAHRRKGSHRSVAPIALANALVIASYTLVDGMGVRRSGAPATFTMWLFLFTAVPPLLWVLSTRRQEFSRYMRGRLALGFLGGAATIGSYGIALWAMTLAPIALVAALRETSILFATAIAALVLRERIGPIRYVAISLIALGAIVIRLAP